ncbi:hypothetical protein [Glutamicibacter sp.]|uniref:hypothetical protein n=1 Tax=Glutamicibacter sp. TaxID=1931995 RepID=UPI0028BD4477|nr:hypothetical protein [Glutamicibacter sp.]
MTASSPRPSNSRRPQTRRAPQWVAPVLAAVVAAGATWAVGMTVFKGSLIEAGQPEAVAQASDAQKEQWLLGAQLADLDARAQALAKLSSDKQESAALTAMETTLSQGADLLGQLSYDDQPKPQIPAEYSSSAVSDLATDVAELSHSMSLPPSGDLKQGQKLAQVAFQMNFDARTALEQTEKKQAASLPEPLHGEKAASMNSAGETDGVACISDPSMLVNTPAEIDGPTAESVSLARALDRGYALDYVLQLEAARGTSAAASAIEDQRKELNDQLDRLRSIWTEGCADLRLPAYQLPEGALKNLTKVSSAASDDFASALLTAAGNTDGQAQSVASSVAFEVLYSNQSSKKPQPILNLSSSS